MSNDTVTRVTNQSWISRVGGAIKGVLVGVVLLLAAFPLLWMNEGRAVRTAKGLQEGAGAVVAVGSSVVDPAMQGRLVHFTAQATTGETLVDKEFAVAVPALRLVREVEMYQWQERSRTEERTKLGGGVERVTTYSYERGWSNRQVDSSRFQQPAGHQNPAMPHQGADWMAERVTAGAFGLPQALVRQIPARDPLSVEGTARGSLREHRKGNTIYLGRNPDAPEVGDLRITYAVAMPQAVSVVGVQQGDTLAPYRTKRGTSIFLLYPGARTAEDMFQSEMEKNTMFTWVLRLVGFLVMFMGLRMVFGPLGVLGDVIPFLGRIVRAGTGLIAFGIAASLSLVTIALAWVYYRPLLGIGLLVLAVLVAIPAMKALGRRREQPAPAA